MAHFSKLSKVVVDAPEESHGAEVAFWSGALGAPLRQYQRFPEYYGGGTPHGGPGFLIQRLGEGPARVHLDFHATDRAAEVARLERLGAAVVDDGEHWTIMRDPAGLVFCVVPDDTLDATNATEWP
jgi:hypothetical protein